MGLLDSLFEENANQWKEYAFCPCTLATAPSFGDSFFIPYSVCPRCGRSKSAARIATAKRVWVPDPTVKRRWWNPLTRFAGHWGWVFKDKVPFEEWTAPDFEPGKWIRVEENQPK